MLLTKSDVVLLKHIMNPFGESDIVRTTPSGIQVFTDNSRVRKIVHKRKLHNLLVKKMLGGCFGFSGEDLGLCYQLTDSDIEVGIYNVSNTTPIAWYFFTPKENEKIYYTKKNLSSGFSL